MKAATCEMLSLISLLIVKLISAPIVFLISLGNAAKVSLRSMRTKCKNGLSKCMKNIRARRFKKKHKYNAEQIFEVTKKLKNIIDVNFNFKLEWEYREKN